MTKLVYFTLFLCALIFSGCQKTEEVKISNQPVTPVPSNTPNLITENAVKADVPRLAGKTAAEIDKILGKPDKITPATIAREMPGEYRLYKIAGNPKGLSVRFYKGKAVRFNLILGNPFASAREALLETFNIDVKNSAPTVDKNEPLSEKWQGTFGGVRFATVYAKKDKQDGQFVMVHAETVD
jgi:hypothetical protein